MSWTVYLLIDPRNGNICYVGGSKNLKARFYQHMSNGNPNEAKNLWIRQLIKANLKPIMEILIACDTEAEMIESEIVWTKRLRAAGCPLVNASRRRAHSSVHPLWGKALKLVKV